MSIVTEYLDKKYQSEQEKRKESTLSEESRKEISERMTKLRESLDEQVKIPVKHEGILEVPEGKNFWDLPLSHYKDLVKKHDWESISRALANLETWNKEDDPDIAKKANKIQNDLRQWVESERENNPDFAK